MAGVLLGYVHPGLVTHEFHRSVLDVFGHSKHQITAYGVRSGVLVSRARNEIVAAFLESPGFDYLWSVDSDMQFSAETLDALVSAKRPIVSALAYSIDYGGEPFPVANVWKDGKMIRVPASRFEGSKSVSVDGVGMGCTLIERRVLEALGPTNDLWPFAETLHGETLLGEDLTFCVRAAEKGFKPVVLSKVRVGHVKQVVL